jgi:ornithine carbamoyltransferase
VSKDNIGYHTIHIPKGVYGDSSKILEEVNELIDAENQGANIMALNELSDIIGAINGYLEKNHPTITLNDLITMSEITKRAFVSGHRK